MVCSKTTLGYFALLVNNSFVFVMFVYNSTFYYKPQNVVANLRKTEYQNEI